jgi:hypothetical protein
VCGLTSEQLRHSNTFTPLTCTVLQLCTAGVVQIVTQQLTVYLATSLLLLLLFPISQQQLVLTARSHTAKRTLNCFHNKLFALLQSTARCKYCCKGVFPQAI